MSLIFMSQEKELEKKFQEYQELAKQNKAVNAAALMMNELENHIGNRVSGRQKKWAYLISVGLPPLGLFFALKFYFFDNKQDSKRAAIICIILTAISIIFGWLTLNLMLSGAGINDQQLRQIQQINLQDIRDLVE